MKLTCAFLLRKMHLLQPLSSVRNRNTLKQIKHGDFDATKKNILKISNKLGSNIKYSHEERLKIGKSCSENGVAMSLHKFKELFPNLTESTARTFRSKYEKEIKIADEQERPIVAAGPIVAQKRWRPLLLGSSLCQTSR